MKKILIISGEESGEMRAAALVHEIKALQPDIQFAGIGGERCRQEGVVTFTDVSELAVMGFTEVLKNISRIKRVFNLTLEHARREKPDLAILVDYPGFNLRLAKELKKLNIKVVYYVSPQIWAWKASRIKIIKKVVDRMMVLFPFEKDVYARYNYTADFTGHPLIDEVKAVIPREVFLRSMNLDPDKPVLGLLPGSRPLEIANLLESMLQAGQLVQKELPDVQLLVLKARNLPKDVFEGYCADAPEGTKVSEDYYNALNACDNAIVCSGTATLETAIMGKPMIVVYRTSWLTSLIVKLLIRIPYISLVNIVAGKKVVEEFLQQDVAPQNLADHVLKLFAPEANAIMRQELERVKTLLGEPGASRRAACVVLNELLGTSG
jgi:lipid-A-disaccharide synthase